MNDVTNQEQSASQTQETVEEDENQTRTRKVRLFSSKEFRKQLQGDEKLSGKYKMHGCL